MADIVIYLFPGACSRVTLNAFEEVGLSYEGRPINLFKGEQKSSDYLSVNPKGKVPAVLIDGVLQTETPAILLDLHNRHPEAKLLPDGEGGVLVQGVSDLAWLASTLQPLVRQIRAPGRLSSADAEGVKAAGSAALSAELDGIAARLEQHPWWYGDHWSIVDVYAYWIHFAVSPVGFSIDRWPVLQRHADAVRARPAFQRALARETAAAAAIGMELPADF